MPVMAFPQMPEDAWAASSVSVGENTLEILQGYSLGIYIWSCDVKEQCVTLISVQVSVYMQTGRVNLIEFYLTLAMKILIPRPCLLSRGMKGFFFSCFPAQNIPSTGVARCSGCSFLSAAHQAAVGECELASLHKINLLWPYCSHRFVDINKGVCVDVLPSTQIAHCSQTQLAVKNEKLLHFPWSWP